MRQWDIKELIALPVFPGIGSRKILIKCHCCAAEHTINIPVVPRMEVVDCDVLVFHAYGKTWRVVQSDGVQYREEVS